MNYHLKHSTAWPSFPVPVFHLLLSSCHLKLSSSFNRRSFIAYISSTQWATPSPSAHSWLQSSFWDISGELLRECLQSTAATLAGKTSKWGHKLELQQLLEKKKKNYLGSMKLATAALSRSRYVSQC